MWTGPGCSRTAVLRPPHATPGRAPAAVPMPDHLPPLPLPRHVCSVAMPRAPPSLGLAVLDAEVHGRGGHHTWAPSLHCTTTLLSAATHYCHSHHYTAVATCVLRVQDQGEIHLNEDLDVYEITADGVSRRRWLVPDRSWGYW